MMPQMPQMNPLQDSAVNPAESLVPELQAPIHEEILKPVIKNADNEDSSKVVISVPKKGIEVVAMAKGFYNQNRYVEGDKFSIRSEQEFGEWMKCVDPAMEKRRIEFYKNKKAKK